jgi:hypothetical protein
MKFSIINSSINNSFLGYVIYLTYEKHIFVSSDGNYLDDHLLLNLFYDFLFQKLIIFQKKDQNVNYDFDKKLEIDNFQYFNYFENKNDNNIDKNDDNIDKILKDVNDNFENILEDLNDDNIDDSYYEKFL